MTREIIEHYEKLAEHYNNLAKLERDKQVSCAPSADEEFYKEQYLEAVALIKKVEEILQWSDEIGLHLSYPAWKLATKIGNEVEPYLMARGEFEHYGSKEEEDQGEEEKEDHRSGGDCDSCKYGILDYDDYPCCECCNSYGSRWESEEE